MESRGNFSAVIWFMARSARFKAKTRISHQRRTRSAREDEMLDYPEQTAEREYCPVISCSSNEAAIKSRLSYLLTG